MTNWKWNGARWWKFDFHAHTPKSDDYGRGSDQTALKRRTAKDWLLDYMKAEVDCVAVTDHNMGAWIDELKRAVQELQGENRADFRDLTVFPGVEMSVNGGVHVLAIFGPEKTTSDIDALIGLLRFGGTRGKSDGETEASLQDVIRAIEDAGGLAIPAHVDADKGLFKLAGVTLQQALDCEAVFAMEVVAPASPKPQLYRDKKSAWTEVLGSDSHHPSGDHGPGSRFTWIKMGTPTLEGLRLALLDGPLSARRSDQETGDPNTHGSLVIEAIEVRQAMYMGRAQPFRVELNPWLNAVIGGRGTGKSTLVEFLRVALRRENELEELPESLRNDFKKYRNVRLNRDDDGLLTAKSQIIVTYRKDRTRYRVQWSPGGDLEPIEVEKSPGQWGAEQGDVSQRFPVRIYSQKQIFELGKAPLALLRIVDQAPEVDRRHWDDLWKEEETRFLSLRAKAREIEAGLADEPRLRGELDDVRRKLAVFEEAGHADVLKEYQKRLRQQREVENWEKRWRGSGDQIRVLAADLVPDPLDASLFDPDRAEDRELLEKATTSLKRVMTARGKLEEVARDLDVALAEWTKNRAASPWKRALDSALGAYQNLRQRLTAEGAGDPAAYGELVQQRQTIEGRLKDFAARREQLKSVRSDAHASLARLQGLRRDLTRRRTEFLDMILKANPYVRIELLPYGARETVESEFRRLLQPEAGRFEKDIGDGTVAGGGLLGPLYTEPVDAANIERRLQEIKKEVGRIATGKHEAARLRDQRFAPHMAKLPPEAFDRLDMWFPEDSLRVEYSPTGDGSRFRPIQEGSPGQRTAALLAFLLSHGDEPIVLDQPEDDLDNELIYDLIVTQLRSIKRRRQAIVVTHNANIVVNGDAELVVALEARGGETHPQCAASLQERSVRDTICAIMEGGPEAFEQRYRRISLEGRHV